MKIKAKVTNTFSCKGKTYTPGSVVRFPKDDLAKLSGFVEILQDQSLTKYETTLMQRSRVWREFCDHCENVNGYGFCQLKRVERYDPSKDCIGWRIKNRKKALH